MAFPEEEQVLEAATADDVNTPAEAGAEGEPGTPGEQTAPADASAPAEQVPAEELIPEPEIQPVAMADPQLKAVLEAIIYVTEEPLTLDQICAAIEQPRDRVID